MHGQLCEIFSTEMGFCKYEILAYLRNTGKKFKVFLKGKGGGKWRNRMKGGSLMIVGTKEQIIPKSAYPRSPLNKKTKSYDIKS